MHLEVKDLLTYLKYVLRTIWQFVSNPRAWRNAEVILWSLFRTFLVGRRVKKIIKYHIGFNIRRGRVTMPWSRKTCARFAWKVACKCWAPQILQHAGIKLIAPGLDKIDWTKNYVFAANHQSTIDALIIVILIKNSYLTPKEGALWWPILGYILKHTQIIIDRKNKNQRVRAITWGMRQYPNQNLLIFPEGTRSKTGLGEFKKGAARCAIIRQCPIVPVTIVNAREVLPTGSLLQLQLKSDPIKVIFGEPISTIGLDEAKDCSMLNYQLREIIQKTLDEEKKKARKAKENLK